MVQRAKARAVSRPMKDRGEQNSDDVDARSKKAIAAEHGSTKIGRPRGRPAATHKITKPAQKAKRPADQAVEAFSKRGNTHAQDSERRRGRPLHEIENGAPVDKRRQRGSQRSKAGSEDEQDESPHSHEEPSEENETSENRDIDPMMMDKQPGEPRIEVHEDQATEEMDIDEVNTAFLQRRIRELIKRYEGLQARHQELREVGVKEAELNFQRLREQADENRSASEKVISQLREELAAQSKEIDQAELLRQQLELSQAEAKEMRASLQTANSALAESKSEIKAMSAKLSASRSNEINAKSSHLPTKLAGPAANRAHQETLQVAQAKEDLYGDLTGLIVRTLKRGQGEDVFDCIQTGRNGSIHFKLGVEKSDGNDYDDVQFTYRPQLDADRDVDVIEMLPDYLTEEITFPRGHASKFYTRLTKALMERQE